MNFTLVGPMPPYRGGIAHFTETMGRGLRTRGHAVTAVTFSRQYPKLFFPGKTQLAPEIAGGEGPEAERLIDTVHPLSWWRAARRIVRRAPDAVLFQYWMPWMAPAYGVMARLLRWRNVPSVAVIHNVVPHNDLPLSRPLARFFLKACTGALTLSEAVQSDLQDLGVRLPARRAAHPVYDRFGAAPSQAQARQQLNLPAGVPVVLFFGFVRPYKGLDTLLEAMPAILEKQPDVHLVVAGEFYDDPDAYHAQVRRHGLEEHVTFFDAYIPDDTVPAFFAAADAVVQPYRTATQSGVAQIAFYFDKPVVTTDVGGLAESIPHEEAGLVVPPEDPPALAGAVLRFFQEEGLVEQLTEGVRRLKARRTDHLYEALEELI